MSCSFFNSSWSFEFSTIFWVIFSGSFSNKVLAYIFKIYKHNHWPQGWKTFKFKKPLNYEVNDACLQSNYLVYPNDKMQLLKHKSAIKKLVYKPKNLLNLKSTRTRKLRICWWSCKNLNLKTEKIKGFSALILQNKWEY